MIGLGEWLRGGNLMGVATRAVALLVFNMQRDDRGLALASGGAASGALPRTVTVVNFGDGCDNG